MEGLAVRVLGVLEVRLDGRVVEVPGSLSKRLLGSFSVLPSQAGSNDDLIEMLWGNRPPAQPIQALRQHLSVLRSLLASAARPGDGDLVDRDGAVYRLHIDHLDVTHFQAAVVRGDAAGNREDWIAAAHAYGAALGCWRGDALLGVTGTPRLDAIATQLNSRRIDVVEAWADAVLHESEGGELISTLEGHLAEHPLRERLRGQLMLALYRSGRQADALECYQEGRAVLADALGLAPSPELRDLETAILRQEPWLAPKRCAARAHRRTMRSTTLPATVQLPDGQLLALDQTETVLGRDAAADVRLVDDRVSRLHARIRSDGTGFVVEDLGSTNGVAVNGVPVDEHPLADGDLISLGGVDLRFRAS